MRANFRKNRRSTTWPRRFAATRWPDLRLLHPKNPNDLGTNAMEAILPLLSCRSKIHGATPEPVKPEPVKPGQIRRREVTFGADPVAFVASYCREPLGKTCQSLDLRFPAPLKTTRFKFDACPFGLLWEDGGVRSKPKKVPTQNGEAGLHRDGARSRGGYSGIRSRQTR